VGAQTYTSATNFSEFTRRGQWILFFWKFLRQLLRRFTGHPLAVIALLGIKVKIPTLSQKTREGWGHPVRVIAGSRGSIRQLNLEVALYSLLFAAIRDLDG
jgi:hypothetical protein